MKKNRENLTIVLLLSIFSLILYFNSLQGIFLFDDAHSIVDNLYIKSFRYIPLFFQGHYTSETDVPKGMFRPLLLLTFSFNYFFSRLQPLGYHIINILLHFLNGILLYSLLKLLGTYKPKGQKEISEESKRGLPFGLIILTTILFIAHPLNTEAVCYISSRSDLLAAFFILSGVLCYLKRSFLLAFGLYVLGLLSKETTLVFPLLLFVLEPIYAPLKNKITKQEKKNLFLFYAFLAGLSIAYWFYRGFIFKQSAREIIPFLSTNPVRSMTANILTQLGVTLLYLKLFLWPNPLVIHHSFPILNSFSEPLVFFPFLIICILVILIFISKNKKPLISIGIGWSLICLLPNFYAYLHVVAAEHHFYLSSFGIYFIIAALFENLYAKYKRAFIIITVGVISLFTILVWFRNYEYSDEFIFWEKTVKADPASSIAHHNLGKMYTQNGLFKEAENEFKKALALAPSYANRVIKNIRENLANTYRLQKKFDKALEEINKNISCRWYNFGTYQSLGVIYDDMGDEKKAQEAWEKGLTLNPRSNGLLYNLGLLYLRKAQYPQAKEYFQKSIETNPDFSNAYYGLARVFEGENNIDAAIKTHEKAILIDPTFADSYEKLGVLYTKKSNPKALWALKETLKLRPKSATAHMFLGIVYASMDPPEFKLAREHTQKAIDLGFKPKEEFLKIIKLEEKKSGEETK